MIEFIIKIKSKIMDSPGIEPGASRMQSERDTTTLQTRLTHSLFQPLLSLIKLSKLVLLTPTSTSREKILIERVLGSEGKLSP